MQTLHFRNDRGPGDLAAMAACANATARRSRRAEPGRQAFLSSFLAAFSSFFSILAAALMSDLDLS